MTHQTLEHVPTEPVQLNVLSTPADPPLRYYLASGRIGVPTFDDYMRALAGGLCWFGAAPLLTRALARLELNELFSHTQRMWARAVSASLGIRLTIEGLEHIEQGERYIITPLHEGFADVLALLQLPLAMRFAVRDELSSWHILGPYLRDTKQISVNPENGAWSYRQLLRAARTVFDKGESLVIFPQGTILGIETDFRSGAFALAKALHRPILPVALTGGHRVWEHPYTPRLRFGQTMSLRVLAPLSQSEVRTTTAEALRRTIQQRVKAAALDGAMAPPRHFIPARDGYWDGYAYEIDPQFAELAADVARRREEMRRLGDELEG